ncbi:uncharacterized protein LOC124342472 [Daphnia pulicaria]|uniref:uncharacterized protein LOC124342472 n=1 Tax=Daphnia pulicaria TaxID=35523 RepID=UPI001EEB288D|nr:uncharacterized protein LOC124342472 [Daphnia pulicaria]
MRNTSSIEKPLMMKVPTRKMFPLMLNPLRGNRILLETLILETTPPNDFESSEGEGERKRKKAERKKKAKKARLEIEGNSTSDEDSDLSSAFSDCSLDEDEE